MYFFIFNVFLWIKCNCCLSENKLYCFYLWVCSFEMKKVMVWELWGHMHRMTATSEPSQGGCGYGRRFSHGANKKNSWNCSENDEERWSSADKMRLIQIFPSKCLNQELFQWSLRGKKTVQSIKSTRGLSTRESTI